MGTISVEKSGRMIWLGRYVERSFTIMRTFMKYFDTMLDKDEFAYRKFLDQLGLPYIYGGRDAFVQHYMFDEKDPNSLVSQLSHAMDNAIVMREDLTTETLSYIQMAQNALIAGSRRGAPMLILQEVIDDLFAFWGSADDNIASEESRNLLKCGKYVERLDLYLRLHYSYKDVVKETAKLLKRLEKLGTPGGLAAADAIREYTADEETFAASKEAFAGVLWNVFL